MEDSVTIIQGIYFCWFEELIQRLNEHTIRVSPYSKSSAHIKPPETFTKYTPWNGFVKLLSIDEMKALEERGFKDAELFFQSKKSSMNPFSNLATSL